MRPRPKQMNLKHHYFHEAVEDGLVTIHAVGTKDQNADLCTKPLSQEIEKFRKAIMG
jgi:hypothetical protein